MVVHEITVYFGVLTCSTSNKAHSNGAIAWLVSVPTSVVRYMYLH